MCKSKQQVCTLHPTCALFGLLSELMQLSCLIPILFWHKKQAVHLNIA